ncbi:hypothetical protein OA342_01530 [Pelagibacteraceae bacterium]|nr:hypothetical protein [Pelagibacteraceae bacterium]
MKNLISKLLLVVITFSFISCGVKEVSKVSSAQDVGTYIVLKRVDIALGTTATVRVDGDKVGTLGFRGTMKIAVNPGGHNLEINCYTCAGSENYNFQIKEGQTMNFDIGYMYQFFVDSVS